MTHFIPLFEVALLPSVLLTWCVRIFLLGGLMTLAACTEDKDFNTDTKTANFTKQNFEESALGLVQAALVAPAHSPLFDVLREEDVEVEGERVLVKVEEKRDDSGAVVKVYSVNCTDGGSATFTFQPAAGKTPPVGNKVHVDYNNCDQGIGHIYVGRAEFTDTTFAGLARDLVPNNAQECIRSIEQDLAALRKKQGRSLEQVNTYTVSGLDLFFVPAGQDIQVRVSRIETNDEGEEEEVVRDAVKIAREETAIIELVDSDTTELYKLTTDGRVIYSVVDRKNKLELCQSMYRTLSAKLTDFGIVREDFNAYMNGTVTLRSSTEDFQKFSGRIVDDSRYKVDIEQGNLRSTYSFEGMSVVKSYAFELDGSMQDVFGYVVLGFIDFDGIGKASLESTSFIGARDELYFRKGELTATGRDMDAVRVTARDDHLINIEAAPEGSENGLFPNYTLSIDVPWEELINREFRHAED